MPKVGGKSILDEALKLHDRGLWIVPCAEKAAIASDWPNTRVPREELEAYLGNGRKLNIGLVVSQTDWIDVECDSDEAEAALLRMFGGAIPPTPTWASARGKHRLFVRPDGLPERAKLDVDGVEFRIGNGKGCSAILPPSIHPSGTRYRWLPGLSLDDVEPAVLPDAIVERLQSERPAPPAETGETIPDGQRNDELFKLACRLFGAGLSADSVERSLLAENEARCAPPLPESEVLAIVHSAEKQDGKGQRQKRKEPTAAEILLDLATASCDLWRTPDDRALATIRRDGHSEHWPVRSAAFRQWLAKEFYQLTGKAAGSQTLQDVTNTLEGMAKFDGAEHALFVRAAEHEGRIYIDLGDDDWRAVEVDPDGWRVVDDPPVRFRRAKGMLPLPEPTRGGTLAGLRRFLNVTDEHWPLLLGWIVAALRPSGPFPIVKLLGEQGSAKTTTARVLRALVDPNTAPVRSSPKSDRDLMIAANNGWVVSLDNLSYVSPELSDALCRLATGGGFATRTLYENDEETIFNAQRPVILNGIEDIGTRSDLLDRCLMVDLPRIEPGARKTEAAFSREFDQAAPGILGALLDAISVALANLPAVSQSDTQWPRMADFAMWAVAAEPALGIEAGEFLRAYADNRETADQVALESSPVFVALRAMLKREGGCFEGTASDTLSKLSVGQDTRRKGWPQAPKVLSGILRRLAPNLRAVGVSVEQYEVGSGNAKRKVWRIESAEMMAAAETESEPSTPATVKAPSALAEHLRAGRKGSKGSKGSKKPGEV